MMPSAPEPRDAPNPVRARLAAVARRPTFLRPSEEMSTWLFLVSLIFSIGGGMALLGLVLLAITLLAAPGAAMTPVLRHPAGILVAMALQLVSACSYLWIGHLLRDRQRQGGTVAVATIVLSALSVLARGGGWASLVVPCIGVVLVASVWRELE